MAQFIDPRCGLPLYLLDNENVASYCGKLEGYVASFFIILILIGAIGYFYFTGKLGENYKMLGVIGIIVVLLAMVVPMFTSWLKKVNWRIYNEQVGSYINNGSTREQAIGKMQELYQTRIQANAITNGSFIMANAMRFRSN
jgi:hypothetical protein